MASERTIHLGILYQDGVGGQLVEGAGLFIDFVFFHPPKSYSESPVGYPSGDGSICLEGFLLSFLPFSRCLNSELLHMYFTCLSFFFFLFFLCALYNTIRPLQQSIMIPQPFGLVFQGSLPGHFYIRGRRIGWCAAPYVSTAISRPQA